MGAFIHTWIRNRSTKTAFKSLPDAAVIHQPLGAMNIINWSMHGSCILRHDWHLHSQKSGQQVPCSDSRVLCVPEVLQGQGQAARRG